MGISEFLSSSHPKALSRAGCSLPALGVLRDLASTGVRQGLLGGGHPTIWRGPKVLLFYTSWWVQGFLNSIFPSMESSILCKCFQIMHLFDIICPLSELL